MEFEMLNCEQNKLLNVIRERRNIILYIPPGFGKKLVFNIFLLEESELIGDIYESYTVIISVSCQRLQEEWKEILEDFSQIVVTTRNYNFISILETFVIYITLNVLIKEGIKCDMFISDNNCDKIISRSKYILKNAIESNDCTICENLEC